MSNRRQLMNVYWCIGDIYYAMEHIRPAEMKRIREKFPELLGIPTMYAVDDDGEVDWFPDCMEGEPIVSVLA